jgi:hypothetical protein
LRRGFRVVVIVLKPHEATLPQISEEALLLWTTCSGLPARAFLEIGSDLPNLYLFPHPLNPLVLRFTNNESVQVRVSLKAPFKPPCDPKRG